MKVISQKKWSFILFALAAILISNGAYSQLIQRTPRFDEKSSVIFFVRPGVTPDSALRFLRINDDGKLVNTNLVKFCPTCDSTLFVIENLGYSAWRSYYRTYSQQQRQKPPTKQPETGATEDTAFSDVSGRLGPLSYIVDYKLSVPDENEGSSFELSELIPSLSREIPLIRPNPVRIGVLDTGLDSAVAKYYKISQLKTCINKGEIGWNFISNSADITDDYKVNNKKYHGLAVTSLIIQQANRSPDMDILPVKVLDHAGKGNLYKTMCGLAYAKTAGVKIINMSLGFYASDRRALRGFEDYIKSLTDAGIIIVTAAGNAVEEEDKAAVEAGMAQSDLRNIDKHPFYPAAFSDRNPNIISVTTVIHQPRSAGGLDMMPNQNFSPARVHVGVFADSSSGAFYLPGINAFRTGSSFAAPIITGQIASIYKQLPKNNSQAINRESILKMMEDKKMLLPNPSAKRFIFNGYTAVHKK